MMHTSNCHYEGNNAPENLIELANIAPNQNVNFCHYCELTTARSIKIEYSRVSWHDRPKLDKVTAQKQTVQI